MLGLLVNPTSGSGRGKALGAEFRTGLSERGIEFRDLSGETLEASNANALAAITDGEIDGLVVLGGDGMVHLGVNLCAEKNIPLMVVGAGTGNDSARNLGMPIHDVRGSLDYLAAHLGETRKVDVARVTSDQGTRYLFGSVSAGFDAIVNARANRLKWPKGPAKYAVSLFIELPSFKPIMYSVTIDGVDREFEGMLIAVANGPAYGGGMQIAPHASIEDGTLDLFIVHKIGRLELVRLFPKVYSGGHVGHPAVEFVRAKKVTLRAKPVPAFADGEYVGTTPFTVEVLPEALKVFG